MGDVIRDSKAPGPDLQEDDLEYEIQARTRYAERRWRMKIVSALAPGAALLVMIIRLSIPFEAFDYYSRRWPYPLRVLVGPDNFILTAVVLAFVTVGALLMLYLQTGFKKENDPAFRRLAQLTQFVASARPEAVQGPAVQGSTKDHAIARRLLRIEETLRSLSRRQAGDELTSSDSRRLIEDLAEKLQRDAGVQVLDNLKQELRRSSVDERVQAALERLARELEALSFRGNLNLTIGVLITIGGIGLLVYFVIFKQLPPKLADGPAWYIVQFVPRLTLVVLIEVFAYFFLRLYKASLGEIKYFQNEITNIESKALALQAAELVVDKEATASIISRLAETDRNIQVSSVKRDDPSEIIKLVQQATALLQKVQVKSE